MTALLWASPLLVVVLLLASGRADTMTAGSVGAALALLIALSPIAPAPLSTSVAAGEIAKGAWLAWLAGSVIFSGLFFQQSLSGTLDRDGVPARPREAAQRRQLFAACFLIGPFAESATGFGIGYVIVLALLSRLDGLRPLPLLLFGLFSQCLVPWGALAVGTVVGAHLADMSTADLGTRSALLTIPLLATWLILFWRLAASSGLESGIGQKMDDVAWAIAAMGLLIAANRLLDVEVAAVASLGPLIVVRFWRDVRPSRGEWLQAARAAAPYAALTAALVIGRAVPPLEAVLSNHLVVRLPLADAPAWPVLLHPATWLAAVALGTSVVRGRGATIPAVLRETWRRGRKVIAATLLFLVMARLLTSAGIAHGLAAALLAVLGPVGAVMAAPVFAAIGGLLTGSTTGSNGLFMPSQVALGAAAGLADTGWLAAIQNTAGSASTMLSPIRVAMGCAFLGRPDLEQPTYRAAWILGVAPLCLMILAAAALLWPPISITRP